MTTDTHNALAAQLADDAADRFLRYVRIDTQSDEDSESYPSSAKQLDLLRLLATELKELGLEEAAIDEHGYVTGTLPSTVSHDTPTIAFFAHADTAREVTGANVNPQRFRYEGGDIPLGSSGSLIRPAESPQLSNHVGHELITTDGTTLLGADDKAGIAEIMAAVAYLQAHPDVPHGTVKIAFNPDEEIGRGVIHFPVDTFGAVAAYTVDGSTAGEVQSETFSGAQVRMKIHGRAIHPGWAKGELVNAIKLAAAIVDKLPRTASHRRRPRSARATCIPRSSRATRRRSSCASSCATSRTTSSTRMWSTSASSHARSPRRTIARRSRSSRSSSTATCETPS